MKRLILVDVKSYDNHGISTGHYIALAKNYLAAYGDTCDVKVGGGPIYEKYFSDELLFKLPYSYMAGESQIKNKWKVLMNCRYLFKHANKDDVIVLQMSGAATTYIGVTLFCPKSWTNVFFIQYSHETLDSIIKKLIFWSANRKIAGYLCPTDRVGKKYKRHYCVTTDYVYTGKQKVDMDTSLYRNKKYDFVMVGGIYIDKGVADVAERLAGTKYRLLIAGMDSEGLSTERLKKAAASCDNIELRLGYVDAKEYYEYIHESRYVMMNYRGTYNDRSSGVVLDALFQHTPVVGRRCGALGFVEETRSGYLFDDIKDFNPEDVVNEKTYLSCLQGIEKYIAEQDQIKENVRNFLGISQGRTFQS